MITAQALSEKLADFLGRETDASQVDGRICVLTPVEYLDCDAVTVYVELGSTGRYLVSDMSGADSRLSLLLGERAVANRAAGIERRFDTEFVNGSMTAWAAADDLPDACWRVAQASAALAEVAASEKPQAARRRAFDDLVADVLKARDLKVERDYEITGQSGHEYKTSIYVPKFEAVVEPIAGAKSFDRAQRIYAQFGDLRQVNGYQLLAVLDDRDEDLKEEAGLLRQVAPVARWSSDADWSQSLLNP